MHIHIYNPIADKDGQYRLKHLLFFASNLPLLTHSFAFVSLLCFASPRCDCFALLAFALFIDDTITIIAGIAATN